MRKTYKGPILSLEENQIFVFGSNPLGINGNPKKGTGGAALVAYNIAGVKQGEIMDNRLSDSGKAWGIVTVIGPGKKRSRTEDDIRFGIWLMYRYAKKHLDKEFLIAYRGIDNYNNNGYSNKELAEMFNYFPIPENIIFEEQFYTLINE